MKNIPSLSVKTAISVCQNISDKFGNEYPLIDASAWGTITLYLIQLSDKRQTFYSQILTWRLLFRKEASTNIEIIVDNEKGVISIAEIEEDSEDARNPISIAQLKFDNLMVQTALLKNGFLHNDHFNWRLLEWDVDGGMKPIWVTPFGWNSIIVNGESGEIIEATADDFYRKQYKYLGVFAKEDDNVSIIGEPQPHMVYELSTATGEDMINWLSKLIPSEELPFAIEKINKSSEFIKKQISESKFYKSQPKEKSEANIPEQDIDSVMSNSPQSTIPKPLKRANPSIGNQKTHSSYRERKLEEEKKKKVRNRRKWFIVIIALISFLSYWLLTPNCTDIDCLKEYFPLSVGNEYEYEREVHKAPLTNYVFETYGHVSQIYGTENLQSGIEKFKILKKVEDEFIVQGEGIEPYGMEKTNKLIWAHREGFGKFIILHEGRISNSTSSTTALAYLMTDPSRMIEQEDIKYINEYSRILFVNNRPYFKILKCTKSYPAGLEHEPVKVERYFAKGIGLVKEIQYNKDEVSYILKLKSYHVK